MADVLELAAQLLYTRWRRAVDLLWRETARRRRANLEERERTRSARRMRNLQKIVRKALSEYHRIELQRQLREDKPEESGNARAIGVQSGEKDGRRLSE